MDKQVSNVQKQRGKSQKERKKQKREKVSKAMQLERPRKVWRDNQVANDIVKAKGLSGTDVRAPQGADLVVQKKQLLLDGQTSTLEVVTVYDERSIVYVALGLVQAAIRKGFQTYVGNADVSPYNAFRYLIETMQLAQRSATLKLTAAPRWFWHFIKALRPKTVKFKTASIKASWLLNQGTIQGITQTLPLGNTADDTYYIYWGTAGYSPVTVNGYGTLAYVGGYSEEAGAASVQAMFSFLTEKGYGELVPESEVSTEMERDTSAFAAVYSELGLSFAAVGGFKVTGYSERQVDSPILAKFAIYQSPDYQNYWRGWQKGFVSGGSASYLGARMCELDSVSKYRNKTPPIFKVFNFDEFFTVLSYTLCQACENIASSNVQGTSIKPCPLTSQQAQLLFRQTLLTEFNNEFAQDLRYKGGGYETWIPFTVGPNGVFIGRQNMLLPSLLAENIRCCKRICHKLKGGNGRAEIDLIPLLGRFTNSQYPVIGNFTWGTSATPLYAPPASEVPINLIDLSCTIASNTYFVDLAGAAFEKQVAMWNEWIQSLSIGLSSLTTVASQKGIAALNVLPYTNIQNSNGNPGVSANAPVLQKQGSKSGLKKYGLEFDMKEKTRYVPEGGSSPFSTTITDFRISSTMGIDSALASYLMLWVLPVAFSVEGDDTASYQTYQSFQVEPITYSRSSAVGFQSGSAAAAAVPVDVRLRNMASNDVKVPTLNQDPELVAGLKTMDRAGGGSFFTALAGAIGGMFGIPGAAALAETIEGQF
jgi:hypothetical protein